jgi:hypothetical protein
LLLRPIEVAGSTKAVWPREQRTLNETADTPNV